MSQHRMSEESGSRPQSLYERLARSLRIRYEQDLLEALEVPRGLLHFGFLTGWALLCLSGFPRVYLVLLTAAVLAVVAIFEAIKARPGFPSRITALVRPFLRDPEVNARYTSAMGTMLALLVLASVFPREAAGLAVAFLGVGDPVARATRKVFARLGLSITTVQSISFATMSFASFLVGVYLSNLGWVQLALASLAAAFAETFLELRINDRFTLDDNFFIPVFAGIALATFYL